MNDQTDNPPDIPPDKIPDIKPLTSPELFPRWDRQWGHGDDDEDGSTWEQHQDDGTFPVGLP